MDYNTRWEKIDEEPIGQGGQGEVFKVIDKQKFINTIGRIPSTIEILADTRMRSIHERNIDEFGKAVLDFIRKDDPNNQGALKILHKPEDARDFERAKERISDEIKAMASLSHPNLLEILDVDDESKWFVSQFYPRGTLAKNLNLFKGNILKALDSFRPLVEAVSVIHQQGYIHRDIKPKNIFLDSSESLILGDFGIVFFTDTEHTRISDTYENVGSRDWMPFWATGRIEDANPSFDLYCLGKVLWSMISGRTFLRGWYINHNDFNLELMFPENRFMRLVNNLLSKCVVEHENQCIIENAELYLKEIDKTKSIIEENASLIHPTPTTPKFPCRICGIGNYVTMERGNEYTVRNFGLRPASGHSLKLYYCDNCGNVQIFDFRDSTTPPLWEED